jgi:acid phosphatase (class A)
MTEHGRATERWAFILLSLAVAACASAAGPGSPAGAPPAMAAEAPTFLSEADRPDLAAILPPAPTEASLQTQSDWAFFRTSRALEGGDRWKLAQSDDDYSPAATLRNYSCAIGVVMTVETAPKVSQLVTRASREAAEVSDKAKEAFGRPRPFLKNEGAICITRTPRLEASTDYPSGHASAGWMTGLVLAELAPDRATQILKRARAYGESRAVCGLHNLSSVAAGRTVGGAVYAALQGNADYQQLAADARREIDALRADGPKPDPTACSREAQLTAPLAPG